MAEQRQGPGEMAREDGPPEKFTDVPSL